MRLGRGGEKGYAPPVAYPFDVSTAESNNFVIFIRICRILNASLETG